MLLLFGTILHTVQDFYSHSNWVENWNDTGFSNNIPTWDEAKEFTEKGNPQAINILNNTYTHYYKIKYPSNGTLSHDELNKDSRYSSEGLKSHAMENRHYMSLLNKSHNVQLMNG